MSRAQAGAVVRVAGFVALLVVALWLGRLTRPPEEQLALAWPAAGVSVWWLLSGASRSRGEAALAAGLVAVTTTMVNLSTGAPPWMAVAFGAANAAHAGVGLLALRRLLPRRRLEAPGDVVRVLVASLLAGAVSASAAALITVTDAVATGAGEDPLHALGLVTVRNVGSTFVVLAAVLALQTPHEQTGRAPRTAELAGAGVASVLLLVVLFRAAAAGLPLLFVAVLVPVWFGTRLGLRATAVTGTVLAVLAVALTLAGGSEAIGVQARALVVQAFIVVLTLVGLCLATLQRTNDVMRSRLEDSRRELQEAADAAVIGKAVVVRGADGGWTLTRPNPALVRLLRRDPSSMRWRELLFPVDSLLVRAAIDRIADGLDDAWQGEVRHLLPGGGAVWTHLHVSRMPAGTGPPAVVAQLLDITERRAAQEELSRLAMHDALTGLPNRTRLHVRLEEMLADSAQGCRVVVFFVDLDGFKGVNDSFGHDVGDAVLQAVAAALLAALRPEDEVGRLGGDEFVACCPGLSGPEEAGHLVRRVVTSLAPALLVRGRDIGLGVSVGWTLSRDGDDSSALLRRSDEAMYDAKRAGKGRVVADPALLVLPSGPA